jgi:hypothetical protein
MGVRAMIDDRDWQHRPDSADVEPQDRRVHARVPWVRYRSGSCMDRRCQDSDWESVGAFCSHGFFEGPVCFVECHPSVSTIYETIYIGIERELMEFVLP